VPLAGWANCAELADCTAEPPAAADPPVVASGLASAATSSRRGSLVVLADLSSVASAAGVDGGESAADHPPVTLGLALAGKIVPAGMAIAELLPKEFVAEPAEPGVVAPDTPGGGASTPGWILTPGGAPGAG
jgi:hypothetical protein